MAKKQNSYMNMVYQSFLNQGLSSNQARAMTAEVGRENDFNPTFLFGTHGDRANGATNVGFFSWQGSRRDNLINTLKQQGLVDKKGNIEPSQRSLDAMAAFAVNEIRKNKAYEETKRKFLNNPDVDYHTAQRVLGKNYIRWDYDGNTLGANVKDHHAKRDRYFQALGGSSPIQAAANYSHKGLRLKSNEAIGGGAAHQGTYALAHNLQNILGDSLKYFSAFNDAYHQSEAYFKKKGSRNSGLHGAGLAMDIALSDPKHAPAAAAKIRAEMNAKGLKEGVDYKLIDEYANPSKGATGGHFDLRFLNAAAAEKYHSPTAPNIASKPSLSLNFDTPKTELMAQNTDIQAAQPEQESKQPENPLSAWETAMSPQTQDTATPTDPTEKWRIKPLEFEKPTPMPDPYAAQYAAGFGEIPQTEKALPDHINALIRNIYDHA